MTELAPPPAPAIAKSAASSGTAPKLVVPKAQFVPPRIILNAVEGWGKTTVGAHAPGSVILMAQGETGYQTLLGSGLVPERRAALLDSWENTLALLDSLIVDTQNIKVLTLDALNGFERQCHQFVCKRDFKGVWGDKGFMSYHKGYDLSVGEWLGFLTRLDRIHQQRIAILLLSHAAIRPFSNPEGENFDRYEADCHKKTWGVTNKWADAVLFGKFETVLNEDGAKVKGIGGTMRTLYTQRRDAYDAKNRYGMPEVIAIPNDHTQSWSVISKAIKGAVK